MGKARFLLVILALASSRAAGAIVSVPAPTCAPVAQIGADGQRLGASGFSLLSSPGNPALPYKDIRLVIPPNVIPTSLSVSLSGSTHNIVPAQQEIAPAPPIALSDQGREIRDWGPGKQIQGNRNVLVYGRSAFYPASHVEIIGSGSLRRWRIATVRYYPFRYNPVTRMLEDSSPGNIVLSYKTKQISSADTPGTTSPADRAAAQRVQALTSNYEQARAWYPSPRQPAGPAQPNATTNYVIVTTSAIVAGSAKLQTFIDHKVSRGFTVRVATESDWGGGTGDAAANNIRAYLQANYAAKGIEYVLLIGNPNPVSGDVPMKMLWPRYSSDTYREAPSDYFYADLTGNWDLNSNGYYGEETGDFGLGGVDPLPEVIVGRIPFYGNFSDLDSILQKTINYESLPPQGGWVRNVLLSMKPSDSTTPGYQLGEAIKSSVLGPAEMNAVRVYDSDYGLSPAPEYTPCTYNNVRSAWQQHAGFHFWWTHGNETLAAEVIASPDCQYLDDAYPSFTFQCSCQNATPENSSNLAYSLLKRGAIATDAATRVSWYYVGETTFTDSDSNAAMTYAYADRLIRQHMPCGDAHFGMLVDVPNEIWMNHCVFNIYGDPSVQYPLAPVISHTPLPNTDVTTQPYAVQADVTTTSPLAPGCPILRWNTTGGPDFSSLQMSLVSGSTYTASIPPQPYDTTIYYYLEAADTTGLSTAYPATAPQSPLSFRIIQDALPPVISHTPVADTADKFGPYVIDATVTDDIGVGSVSLHYSYNGGPSTEIAMTAKSGGLYEASIPGSASSGDVISYYITATDTSARANSSRLPAAPDVFSFHILGSKIYVAVLNTTNNPSYFVGGNMNAWSEVSNIINADPAQRFHVSVVESLSQTTRSIGISGQDVLVLPDNAVPIADLQTVSDWFVPGKVIVAMDSSTCYAAYTGWMWPDSVGTHGYGVYWDYSAETDDQQIWAQDPITAGYTVGDIIGSAFGDSVFLVDQLPADAHVLSGRASNPNCAYAVYRDVPGRGRLVLLGPYVLPIANQADIIRESLIAPPLPRQLNILSPNGGETYSAGDAVQIRYAASGTWQAADKVRLEYCTGLDSTWQPIPGADSLNYDLGSFQWNTAGLPGSHFYRVRATWAGDTLSDASDQPFTIVPTVDIAAAKASENGQLIKLAGKIVTSGVVGICYVEEPDRRAGIRINWTQSLTPSALVDIVGSMDTSNGERVLNAESVDVLGTGAQIKPISMSVAALGGAAFGLQDLVMQYRLVNEAGVWVPRMIPAVGLNNVGLLVRLCGTITTADGLFYIDDGSASPGARLICPEDLTYAVGRSAIVDAISGTYFDGAVTCRCGILPSKQNLKLQ